MLMLMMPPCKKGYFARTASGRQSSPRALRTRTGKGERVRRRWRWRWRIGGSSSRVFPQHQRLQAEGRGDRARCRGQCITSSTGRLGLGTGPESAVVREAQTWDRPATYLGTSVVKTRLTHVGSPSMCFMCTLIIFDHIHHHHHHHT